MPIYEYLCPNGHTVEIIRRYPDRDEPVDCLECGEPTHRLPPMPHVPVDGIYSYAPNVGTAREHERKNAVIEARREGKPEPKREGMFEE